jgi:sorbitol-specific phosphotransferase system component IIC
MQWAFHKMFYKTLNPSQKKFIIFSPSQKKPSKYDFTKMNIHPSFPLSFPTINKAKYYTN